MAQSDYRERQPPPDLARDVQCLWRGHVGTDGPPYTDRVLPDACVDLIWDGRQLFVAGPDTRAVPLQAVPGRTFIGIRMRPGRARALLGCPASEALDRRVDLADLWPASAAARLLDSLGGAAPDAVEQALEHALRERLARGRGDDRVVDAAVRVLQRPAPSERTVHGIAARLGVTQRSLHRRCTAALGYGPKTLDLILRFQRARALARAAPAVGLAQVAFAAGYADQAHLTRECRRLSGLTPSELFKSGRGERG